MSFLDGLGKVIVEATTKYQLFIDMDGVLTNFEKEFSKVGADLPFREYELKYGKKQTWELIKTGGLEFWKDMEWMSDGKKLWEYVKQYNPVILTSPANHDESWIGKKMWIERELGNDVLYIFERDKFKYAGGNRILIDDFFMKIDGWEEHGGVGILHKNADNTILQLQKYLK